MFVERVFWKEKKIKKREGVWKEIKRSEKKTTHLGLASEAHEHLAK